MSLNDIYSPGKWDVKILQTRSGYIIHFVLALAHMYNKAAPLLFSWMEMSSTVLFAHRGVPRL